MSETRNRYSVQVNEAGKQKLIEDKAAKQNYKGKLWTYWDITTAASVSRKTVQRFFAGEVIDYSYADAIARALDLELTDLIDPKELNSPAVTPETLESPIDWRDICHTMLEAQLRRYQFRRQATGAGLGHEVNIYVPLGLVKPTIQPRRGEEFCPTPAEGRLQYQPSEKEIEKRFEADEFLTQVIEAGEGKNIAIIGEPGAGKSTWLEQIARHLVGAKHWDERTQTEDDLLSPQCFARLPICIQLGSLDGKTLEEYLLQVWLKEALSLHGMVVTAEMQTGLIQLFNSRQVWLLLDGVDEVAVSVMLSEAKHLGDSSLHSVPFRMTSNPLQEIANQLRGWVAQARTVLTCRLNVWQANDRALPNFETYRTLDFDESQVGKFIGDWFAKAGKPELGELLQDKLGESGRERIRDLIRNPLRLALLCQTWAVKQGDLPKTKAMLYQQFREGFYKWKPHPLLTEDLDKQDELHEALGKLALEAIDQKLPLRKRFVHKVMGKSLFKLATDSGWLNEVYCDAETDEPVYAFWHLTFQEYFAALAIDDWHFFLTHDNDNPQPLPGNFYRIFEPQWKEVILLWLGRGGVEKEQKEEFIQALVEFEDACEITNFYRYQAYFLGAAGLAEFEDCIKANEIVSQIINWSFGYPDIEQQGWVEFRTPIRQGGKVAIRQTNRPILIKLLLPLLDNNQYKGKSRHEIIEILGEIGCDFQIVVNTLENIIETGKQCCTETAACCLAKNPNGKLKVKAIQTLINLLPDSKAVTGLGSTNFRNLDKSILDMVIAALTKNLEEAHPCFWFESIFIAPALIKITPSNHPSYKYAIDMLTEQLRLLESAEAQK